MQRNTSFFWASDELRDNINNGDDNEVLYEDDDGHGNGNGNGIDIGWSVPTISEEENDTDSNQDEPASERITLNQNFQGYGSAINNRNGGPLLLTPGATVDNQHNNQHQHQTTPSNSNQRRPVIREYYSSPVKTMIGITPTPTATTTKDLKAIRFQVVIWHIGTIDVQTGFINMRFRLTLFWNDIIEESSSTNKAKNNNMSQSGGWVMQGRQRAYRNKQWNHQESSTVEEMIDVPPVSIMNAVEFETVDAPEITMVNTQTRSMRWTCMYNAKLFQGDHMSVKDFPHDVHQIQLKIGILAHRGRGMRWDRSVHKLDLANEGDSQGSTRVPHGLVVDHCHVPDFGFDPSDLGFEFSPLMYGGRQKNADTSARENDERDVYLQVTLPVYRQSGHYDTSILPILVMLNIVAISCLTRNFGSATAATELMLGIAFVQVGIRLTLDSRLPSVGYQIKMQKVMNCCFWLLCGLVLESNVVFFLVRKLGWDYATTDKIDLAAACVALMYNGYIIVTYFRGRNLRQCCE